MKTGWEQYAEFIRYFDTPASDALYEIAVEELTKKFEEDIMKDMELVH